MRNWFGRWPDKADALREMQRELDENGGRFQAVDLGAAPGVGVVYDSTSGLMRTLGEKPKPVVATSTRAMPKRRM